MKRFLFILTAFLSFTVIVAQAKEYGINDIPNVHIADRTRFVSNPDGILSREAVYRIDTMLYSLKESGRAQVVVVAVNSIGSEDPFTFLQTLLTKWGVGRKETSDGLGVLLVIDQGAIEIQTGYGLEGDLPDALLKRIIDRYMIPAFREQNWNEGMTAGMDAISNVLNGRTPVDLAEGSDDLPIGILLIFFCVPILLIILVLMFSGRCPKCHKRKLKRVSSEIVYADKSQTVRQDTYVCQNCGHTIIHKNREHHDDDNGATIIGGGFLGGMLGGMGGGRGGFGGGGSFGGGGFGGGGARGSF